MDKAYLSEYFDCDPETGTLTWMVTRGSAKKGNPAGHLHSTGYVTVRLHRKLIFAHRIVMIWAGVNLRDKDCVDHINGIPSDNRIVNLRIATQGQNRCNSKRRSDNISQVKGVSLVKKSNKYKSRITFEGKDYHLGTFNTAEEAHAKYQEASKKMHGEFGRFE